MITQSKVPRHPRGSFVRESRELQRAERGGDQRLPAAAGEESLILRGFSASSLLGCSGIVTATEPLEDDTDGDGEEADADEDGVGLLSPLSSLTNSTHFCRMSVSETTPEHKKCVNTLRMLARACKRTNRVVLVIDDEDAVHVRRSELGCETANRSEISKVPSWSFCNSVRALTAYR